MEYDDDGRRIWYERVKKPGEVDWNVNDNAEVQDWTWKMLRIVRELNPIVKEMNSRFVETQEIVRFHNTFEILQGKYCSSDLMIKVIQGKSDDAAIKKGVQEAIINIKNWAAKLNGYYGIETTKELVKKYKLFFG